MSRRRDIDAAPQGEDFAPHSPRSGFGNDPEPRPKPY